MIDNVHSAIVFLNGFFVVVIWRSSLKNWISLIHVKSKRKFKALNEVDVGNGVIDRNVKYSSCGEVEALGYFPLSGMIYNDRNAVNKGVSTTVL